MDTDKRRWSSFCEHHPGRQGLVPFIARTNFHKQKRHQGEKRYLTLWEPQSSIHAVYPRIRFVDVPTTRPWSALDGVQHLTTCGRHQVSSVDPVALTIRRLGGRHRALDSATRWGQSSFAALPFEVASYLARRHSDPDGRERLRQI